MMKLHDTIRLTALALSGAGLLAVAPDAVALQQEDAAQAQAEAQAGAPAVPDIAGTTVLLSSDLARLELELASGETHAIELNDGQVLVNGEARGSYRAGGPLERSWRDLLRSPEIDATEGLAPLLAGWEPADAEAASVDASGLEAVLSALDRYDPAVAAATAAEAGAAADAATTEQAAEQVTIVPRAGSIDQLAERLRELNRTMGRIAGEEFELDGNFALVVHDDYRIADGRTIAGDVALLGGTLTVDGDIEGDVLVLGGDLLLEPGSLVMGDVRSMGGNVETTGATVTGEILALSALEHMAEDADVSAEVARRHDAEWDYDRRRDRGFFDSIFHNVTHAVGDLIGTIIWLVILTLMGALLVYFAPTRLETIASEASGDVLRSFGVGLAGQLLFFPILLLLVVMIVTWLVIPFYLLAVAVAIPAGYVAAARGIGEAVVDRKYDLFERFDLNRQNTYYYVLNGFVVLLAPFALAAVLHLFGNWFGFLRGLSVFVGVVLTWAAATTGFGAIILTRGGGLMRDFRGFRKRRSVPLDDLRAETPDPGASSAHASDGDSDDVNADEVDDVEDDDA